MPCLVCGKVGVFITFCDGCCLHCGDQLQLLGTGELVKRLIGQALLAENAKAAKSELLGSVYKQAAALENALEIRESNKIWIDARAMLTLLANLKSQLEAVMPSQKQLDAYFKLRNHCAEIEDAIDTLTNPFRRN